MLPLTDPRSRWIVDASGSPGIYCLSAVMDSLILAAAFPVGAARATLKSGCMAYNTQSTSLTRVVFLVPGLPVT